jgi:hypothetical protein
MRPGWVPLRVEIQSEVGFSVALVGLASGEGDRSNRRSVRKKDPILVLMNLHLTTAVVRVDTLWELVHRPMHTTVSAHLNSCNSH